MRVNELRDSIAKWASTHHEEDLLDGIRCYLGDREPRGNVLLGAVAFALVAPSGSGPSLIERWTSRPVHRSRAERLLLTQWAASWFGILRVVEVHVDEGLLVHDVLADRVQFVRERSATHQMSAGDWFAAFWFDVGDHLEFEGTMIELADVARIDVVQAALAAGGRDSAAPAESRRIARAVCRATHAAHRRPRFVNADGHDILVVTLTLSLTWDDVLAVVSSWPDAVVDADHVDVFGPDPVQAAGGDAVRAVFRSHDTVTVFANSRERLDALLARWTEEVGTPLPVLAEKVDRVESHPDGRRMMVDSTRVSAESPQQARDALLAEADGAWPDVPLPVLGGQTPREALAAGRTAEVWALVDRTARGEKLAGALGLRTPARAGV